MVLETGYTLGFIGAGNMGGAVLSAAIKAAAKAGTGADIVPSNFVVSAKTEATRSRLQAEFGDKITVVDDNQRVIDESHVVVLAFKPWMVGEIMGRLHYSHFTVLVSLLAGTTIETIRQYTSVNAYIVRATTNTAATIGMAMTALTFQGEYIPESPITQAVEWVFTQTGKYIVVDEAKQDVCIALNGSGPAFAYLFLEALTDGAVMMGLPYDTAKQCAAQVLAGAGQMVLDGNHPAVLRNAVCTPGGTTINGLAELEDRNVRGAVIRAVEKSTRTATEISMASARDAPHAPSAFPGQGSHPGSRTASTVNLAEMAQQISISRRNTLNARQPTL